MNSAEDPVAVNVTAGSGGIPLYARQVKAYPRFLNKGNFRRLKWAAMIAMLAIYWLSPWIRWSRGAGAPDQAILIDLPGRRAYFFFIEIWPQEVYYLTGLLIIAALALFFVSALLGRVWCGFACWQTVFTDLFVWIEELFEGGRNKRIALDKAPMSMNKFLRKSGKHAVWLLLSVLIGWGFVLYFDDAGRATVKLLTGEAGMTAYGSILVVGGMAYLLAGFAREQVCVYMCPYSRFQSAMFDEHSMIVSYEAWRGEPRSTLQGAIRGRPVEEVFAGRGHCVDCMMCVQVCPTGIDIRDGNQLACIGCALCVDACNSVMDRLGLPRGLISYDSTFNQAARSKGDMTSRTRLWRPRVFVYLAVIGLVGLVMLYALSTRKTYDINILHERAPLYVEISGHRVRNGYTIKILNKARLAGHFRLRVEGLPDDALNVIGNDGEPGSSVDLSVGPDQVGTYHLFVTAPKAASKGARTDIVMVLEDLDNHRLLRHPNIFAGPEQ